MLKPFRPESGMDWILVHEGYILKKKGKIFKVKQIEKTLYK